MVIYHCILLPAPQFYLLLPSQHNGHVSSGPVRSRNQGRIRHAQHKICWGRCRWRIKGRWLQGWRDTVKKEDGEGRWGRKSLRLQDSSEKCRARLMKRPRVNTAHWSSPALGSEHLLQSPCRAQSLAGSPRVGPLSVKTAVAPGAEHAPHSRLALEGRAQLCIFMATVSIFWFMILWMFCAPIVVTSTHCPQLSHTVHCNYISSLISYFSSLSIF